MLQKVLYAIWFLLPLFFFTMALWSKLEKVGGKKQQERPEDFLRQGIFVLVCVLIAVGIDQYMLRSIYDTIGLPFVPFGFLQLMLLPLVLLVFAKVVGPTKDIQISKSPDLSKGKRR